MTVPPFHLAFPVTDLPKTRSFFAQVLGATVGRESERWIDFDFFGHQITAHLVDNPIASVPTNSVSDHDVPVCHFGAILDWDAFHALADRLKSLNIHFLIEPHIRFKNQVGEQATFFISDPSGNGIEFKAFKDKTQVFKK